MKSIFIIGLALLLTACAAMEQMAREAQQQQISQTCRSDVAYASGVNDASSGRAMRVNYAYICPRGQQQLNESYRLGYKYGLAHPRRIRRYRRRECLTSFGEKVCGYNCIKSRFGAIGCAASPQQHCLVSKIGGHIDCGYICATSGSIVKCSKRRNETCAKTAFDVKCGRNCRVVFGKIICDRGR